MTNLRRPTWLMLFAALAACTSQRAYWLPVAHNPESAQTLSCEATCNASKEPESKGYFSCLEACPSAHVYETGCAPDDGSGHCHQQTVSALGTGAAVVVGVIAVVVGGFVLSLRNASSSCIANCTNN